MLQRHQTKLKTSRQFIEKAEALRDDHPEIGCRKMALILKQPGWGRDKTEVLLMSSGFRIIYPPNYTKTTDSAGFRGFDNLIEGLVIKRINQVIQTDITYLWVKDRFYYLVFIIDVYSRRITGYNASCGMEAEANLKALNMMIQLRGKENIEGLIHHSDRGSQYNCKAYLSALKEHGIKVSMCIEAWENAYSERINRTIKHEYLRNRDISSLNGLKKELDKAVRLYNEKRPHWSLLQQMAPSKFEDYVDNLPKRKRPKVMIYKADKELSTKTDVNSKKKKEAKKKK
jgi:transposase InsO family protein